MIISVASYKGGCELEAVRMASGFEHLVFDTKARVKRQEIDSINRELGKEIERLYFRHDVQTNRRKEAKA